MCTQCVLESPKQRIVRQDFFDVEKLPFLLNFRKEFLFSLLALVKRSLLFGLFSRTMLGVLTSSLLRNFAHRLHWTFVCNLNLGPGTFPASLLGLPFSGYSDSSRAWVWGVNLGALAGRNPTEEAWLQHDAPLPALTTLSILTGKLLFLTQAVRAFPKIQPVIPKNNRGKLLQQNSSFG